MSSIKLTPLRKLQANGETSRTLQTAKLCYNAININIVRKINQSSQFNNVFREMLSGNKYIYFCHDFMCSNERMCGYGRYSPDVYIYFFLVTDVRERGKGVVFFDVLCMN